MDWFGRVNRAMKKRSISSGLLTTFFIGLLLYSSSIPRYERNFAYDLLMFASGFLLLVIAILFISNFIFLVRSRRYQSAINFTPVGLNAAGILFVFWPLPAKRKFRRPQLKLAMKVP